MSPTPPQVIILTEASSTIGLGHQSRCQALADAFTTLKINAGLLVNTYPEKLSLVDLIIIDSYKLPLTGYKHYQQYCRFLVVTDDTKRMKYPADIVINPALGAERLKYDSTYTVLAGAQYTLLKKEFWKLHRYHKKIRKNIKHVLITLGASTPLTVSKKISTVLKRQNSSLEITIAHGKHPTKEMISLMKNTDVAISAGGQTLHELACLGVPTIALQTADNQKFNLSQWLQVNFIDEIIQPSDKDFLIDIQNQLAALSFNKRVEKSALGKKYCDGQGALRTAQALIAYTKNHD